VETTVQTQDLLTIGYSPADCTTGEGRIGGQQLCAITSSRWLNGSVFKSALGGIRRHTYCTLLRSLGVEFKVMQELMRHSSLRSTLDVYTQAVGPAKRAAQDAMLSLFVAPPDLAKLHVSH
jgi:hypothetical protein